MFRTNLKVVLAISIQTCLSLLFPLLDIESSEISDTGQPFAFDMPQLFCGIYKNQMNSLSAVPRTVLDFIHTLREPVV